MAAVAGAVAEAVLAAMTEAAKLDRAYVNNGGDIALHLAPDQSYNIGMVERPETSLALRLRTKFPRQTRPYAGSPPVAGVVAAFRSASPTPSPFLPQSAADADAAATIIANAVDLPGHSGDHADSRPRDCSGFRSPRSPRHPRCRPAIRYQEIDQALDAGEPVAEELQAQGLIHAAALCLQGQVRLVSDSSARVWPILSAATFETSTPFKEPASMPEVKVRKRVVTVEEIFHEGGPVAATPLRRAASLAVIHNPFCRKIRTQKSPVSWKI